MTTDDMSRRSLIQALAAMVGAWPAGWVTMAEAAQEAHAASQARGGATLALLSQAEAAEVEAVAAQIIPTDDTPGAREAGVVYFIDRALATFLSQLAADYRTQLTGFRAACRTQHPGIEAFASLTSERQVAFLRTVDHTPFFDTTRLLTLLGMFSLPAYGGNRRGIGWQLIGFEDRHVFRPPFGHYDRDYPGFVIERAQRP